MHLCGFCEGNKAFDVFCCLSTRKNSLLSFWDLSEYGHCKDFIKSSIVLIWICGYYSIVKDTSKNNLKKPILLI